jgi:5-methylthioribose kinase
VAACSLARIDGKSPVEYLDADQQAIARSFAREALLTAPATWDDLCGLLVDAAGGGNKWRL